TTPSGSSARKEPLYKVDFRATKAARRRGAALAAASAAAFKAVAARAGTRAHHHQPRGGDAENPAAGPERGRVVLEHPRADGRADDHADRIHQHPQAVIAAPEMLRREVTDVRAGHRRSDHLAHGPDHHGRG